jgi:hypothetical protein
VGNGNIDVGTKTPIRKTGRPKVGHWFGGGLLTDRRDGQQVPPRGEPSRISGAMAEQRGDSGRGDQSAPQKLVRLVGCRDTQGRPASAPQKNPVKRG